MPEQWSEEVQAGVTHDRRRRGWRWPTAERTTTGGGTGSDSPWLEEAQAVVAGGGTTDRRRHRRPWCMGSGVQAVSRAAAGADRVRVVVEGGSWRRTVEGGGTGRHWKVTVRGGGEGQSSTGRDGGRQWKAVAWA
jgi:hypothetical protein